VAAAEPAAGSVPATGWGTVGLLCPGPWGGGRWPRLVTGRGMEDSSLTRSQATGWGTVASLGPGPWDGDGGLAGSQATGWGTVASLRPVAVQPPKGSSLGQPLLMMA